jgi:hypothetical protein
VIALGRRGRAWLAALVFPALILVYSAYWIGSDLYGPRYFYEGLYSLSIVSAAGIFWLAGIFRDALAAKWMTAATGLLVGFLVCYNLIAYLPARLGDMNGLYGIRRSMFEPFQTRMALSNTPALVIVHYYNEWTEYGGLLELQNAELTSPFIFALSRSPDQDARLAADYPDRRILYYYTNHPGTFYTSPP